MVIFPAHAPTPLYTFLSLSWREGGVFGGGGVVRRLRYKVISEREIFVLELCTKYTGLLFGRLKEESNYSVEIEEIRSVETNFQVGEM